jgi:hypothetical protein
MKVEPADQKLRRNKSNLLQHVTKMNYDRTPKTALNYSQMDEDNVEDLGRDY